MLRRDAGNWSPKDGPWIRKRQVARRFGPELVDAPVEVVDAKDRVIGWGLYSPASDIAVRMIAFAGDGRRPPPPDWLERNLAQALEARAALNFRGSKTSGFREVNSEGDQLPGLVVDRYGDDRVVLVTTAAMAALQDRIVAWLRPRTEGRLFVHTPKVAAEREDFVARPVVPAQAEVELAFTEENVLIHAPPPPAQKTGAFFDQRENHVRIAEFAHRLGGPVLDIGCHLGGFALHAAVRGCAAVGVDQSQRALGFARQNAERNGVGARLKLIAGDLFRPRNWLPSLQELASEFHGPYAAVIVDPPAVAKTRRDVSRARTALAKVVGQLAGQVKPGGLLVVCSCSHHLDRGQLDRLMLMALGGHSWPRVMSLGAGPDHPVTPGHVQGEYLRVNVYQRRVSR